jgi:hypothetical protein
VSREVKERIENDSSVSDLGHRIHGGGYMYLTRRSSLDERD